MERAGRTPSGAIRDPDLEALAERPGPFATVWTGRSGVGRWGEQADDARATDVRSDLAAAGAPEHVIRAVSDALEQLPADAEGAVVVADEQGIALVEPLPDRPRAERAVWAALPALAPVVEHRQANVPSLIVLADRAGADIIVTGSDGETTVVDVEGEDSPITKSAPGGWSQRRFQQRVEDSWEHNARAVVDRVRELADRVAPELLVLGGDERAVELVSKALPAELRELTRIITPGRAADGSDAHRDAEVARLVRTAVAERTVELLRTFEQEDGRGARAANGVGETFSALQQSQVDVLLVHDDGSDERTAWFAADPGIVAVDEAELAAFGVAEPRRGRLLDVAVNAALRTGASVRVVPAAAALHDSVAAILRWSP